MGTFRTSGKSEYPACIKGDAKTAFPIVMQEKNVNKFNLITSLKGAKINLEEIRK